MAVWRDVRISVFVVIAIVPGDASPGTLPASAAKAQRSTPRPVKETRTAHFVAVREQHDSQYRYSNTRTVRGGIRSDGIYVGHTTIEVAEGSGDLLVSDRWGYRPLTEIDRSVLNLLEVQHGKLAGLLGDRSASPLRVTFQGEPFYEVIEYPRGHIRKRVVPRAHNCESKQLKSLEFLVGGLTPALVPELETGAWHQLIRAYVCDKIQGWVDDRDMPLRQCDSILGQEFAHALAAYWDGARIDKLLDRNERVALASGSRMAIEGGTTMLLADPRQLPAPDKRLFDSISKPLFPLARLDYTGDLGLMCGTVRGGLEALALVEYLMSERGQKGMNEVLDEIGRRRRGDDAEYRLRLRGQSRRWLAESAGAVLVHDHPYPQYAIPGPGQSGKDTPPPSSDGGTPR
jgi:hypothetical protein